VESLAETAKKHRTKPPLPQGSCFRSTFSQPFGDLRLASFAFATMGASLCGHVEPEEGLDTQPLDRFIMDGT